MFEDARGASRAGGEPPLVTVWGAAIVVSACLLFSVQPMLGRVVLPWFGGTAPVWSTCLLFFQAMLLLGYAYAHASVRWLSPRVQGTLHLALLVASLAFLPLAPDPALKGGVQPAISILALLAKCVGLPLLLISATAPLVQSWYARLAHRPLPWRLFALSNAGSMLALLAYPAVIEPALPVSSQLKGWSAAYLLFAALVGTAAARAMRAPGEDAARAEHGPGLAGLAGWLALAAFPSALLLAVTNHLCLDVAAFPFLWVLTLALYLLSYILCFESDRWYQRAVFIPLMAVGFAGMAYVISNPYNWENQRVLVPLFAGGLFAACMVCHGELARRRPVPEHLTAFYLMGSLGGAMGGMFVALLAPVAFVAPYELPISMLGCALVACAATARDAFARPALVRLAWVGGALLTLALARTSWLHAREVASQSRLLARNFYGSLQIRDFGQWTEATRNLTHGIIIHGEQRLDERYRRDPLTYFSRDSGVGRLLSERLEGPRRVGIVGLGAGTLAAYGREGDVFRFYEINPLIIDLARTQFTYLSDCRAAVEIVPGDARLSLESEPPQRYDVLVLDAFSSDAIPVHLLTREALDLYLRHLAPGGVVAIHVSNKHLDLAPVVGLLAEERGLQARVVESQGVDGQRIFGATWVLVSADPSVFALPKLKDVTRAVEARPDLRVWTDDYSNLLQVLN